MQLTTDKKIPVSDCLLLQVVFEGIAGNSFTGDTAIDTAEINEGSCPGKTSLHVYVETLSRALVFHASM